MKISENKKFPSISNDEERLLGERLRALRKARGLSIQVVAERAGVSRTYLGRVENGIANPSVGTIKQIANVLGAPLALLFDLNVEEATSNSVSDPNGNRQEVIVVRKGNRKTLGFPNSQGFTFLLTPDLQRKMEVILSTLPPGEGISDPYSHEGEEFGFVLEGTFEVQVAGRVYILNEGDSIYFPSQLEHSTRVVGEKTATTLWVITPPSF